ncbi:MAG: ribosome maturation factor RimP [Gammaproteobacteria bacterium]|nr:ribosome maturation factor RimP [Gammaproteobacteria bacterium]
MSEVHKDQIIALLEPEIEQLGYELADIEVNLVGGGGVLRLFIDKEDGIALEDCEKVSRQVSALLDVEDPIPGEYSLEVSSPGLNRRLVKAAHFERFAGSKVKLKLKRIVEGRRNYKGRLVGYEEPNVLVKEGKETFAIPFQEIDTARVVPEF